MEKENGSLVLTTFLFPHLNCLHNTIVGHGLPQGRRGGREDEEQGAADRQQPRRLGHGKKKIVACGASNSSCYYNSPVTATIDRSFRNFMQCRRERCVNLRSLTCKNTPHTHRCPLLPGGYKTYHDLACRGVCLIKKRQQASKPSNSGANALHLKKIINYILA